MSDSQERKFRKIKVDYVTIQVPYGFKKQIEDHLATIGVSMNSYINEAIKEKMVKENLDYNLETDDGDDD